ncbi:hypothetical protein FNV43_RR09638 [Rhamnella rubrinervis]|uniref:DNA topoisomerase 6 subunit B n=1 Tax=Rhamnella rubrinervis TaxID=2594499 RepID=A0A8K0HAB7_9ROSA|nr:hypothetical protein FNV43_RR09638 [Rhamnella rubrinervis]
METGSSDGSPPGPKKGKTKAPTKPKPKPKESALKQKSPAEFFAENKNIAGFDNVSRKSLYTTVRELVENSLDSAESISELPVVEITIEEIGKSKFNSMIGLVDRDVLMRNYMMIMRRIRLARRISFLREYSVPSFSMIDISSYKRLAKEASSRNTSKNAALGKKVKEAQAPKAIKGRGEASFYRVTCKDNGRGMPHDDIPNMFGRVLSGTKYGLKQTRGKFGLGAKMALIWSKMSTGLPIEISSSMKGQNYISFCRLDIDIHRNIPHIHAHEKGDNKEWWHGAEIQVVIEGNWTTYRVLKHNYKVCSRTDVMPPIPLETKHHPSSVDLLLIKRLITDTSKQNLLQFLQHEFVNIGKSYADRLIVKSLTSQQIVRIHQLFRQAKFDDPSGDCLSPAGEYNLRLGIVKELHPDMVATYSGSAQVFEGHPFIVEAGVSVGGKDVKQGLNIFRFANRIPLLFEQGADVITRTALKRINWNSYKINQTQDKIGVFVSIVSTKIPFKGTGKEYIGDDISEIASAVKSAIQQCCIQLKTKIVKKLQAREQQERKRNLSKYLPDATGAIYDVLKEMSKLHASKKKRYNKEDAELLGNVSAGLITKETLREKLAQRVEQVDYEMALEYATQSGVSEEPREAIFLQALEAEDNFIDLHNPIFVQDPNFQDLQVALKMAKASQIAILGAGIFVRTQYIPRLAEISNLVVLKAIWSRTEESARRAVEIAQKSFPGVESKWGDKGLEEIVEDNSILGVAVVLAGQAQIDYSLRLLKAGKHVLQAISELETALASYNSIFNNAPSKPIWAVAENYRFEPALLEGKKLISDIGDMMSVQVIIEGSMNSSNPYFSSSWRRDFTLFNAIVMRVQKGFILDMGVHFIAGLRMIYWRVVGLKGTIQIERGNHDGRHGYVVLFYGADGQSKSTFYPFSGVTEEFKSFLHDISQATLKKGSAYEAEPRLSFVEGARDVAILEAMLESGTKQGAVVHEIPVVFHIGPIKLSTYGQNKQLAEETNSIVLCVAFALANVFELYTS